MPSGSKFSMLQMVMMLPSPSRITSYSTSFQPLSDFLDQDLRARIGQRRFPPARLEFGVVVGEARAKATEGVSSAHDDRIANLMSCRLSHGGRERRHRVARRHGDVDLAHLLREQIAVLGHLQAWLDRACRGCVRTLYLSQGCRRSSQGDHAVQRGLAAEAGDDGVGTLLGDDLRHPLGLDGVEVDLDALSVGVGLDGGDVRIDEDDLTAFLESKPSPLACPE